MGVTSHPFSKITLSVETEGLLSIKELCLTITGLDTYMFIDGDVFGSVIL
jgi:hypothetical protein